MVEPRAAEEGGRGGAAESGPADLGPGAEEDGERSGCAGAGVEGDAEGGVGRERVVGMSYFADMRIGMEWDGAWRGIER